MNEDSFIQNESIEFEGDLTSKKDAIKLLDKVIKEQGDFGVYCNLSGGLEEIIKYMNIKIVDENDRYSIHIYPKSGSGGHDFRFTINKKTGKRSYVAVGEVLPTPDFDKYRKCMLIRLFIVSSIFFAVLVIFIMAKHYNNINTAKEHSVESIPNPEEGMSYDKFVETVPKIKTHMNATQVLNIMGQPLLQWRYITTKPSEVIVEGVAITFKGKEAVKIDPLLVKGTNITDNEYSEKARLIRNILFEKNNKNYFVSVEPINTTHTIILLNKYKYFSYEITHCYDPEGGHYSNSRYVLAINTADGALQLLRDDTKVANHISHLSCKSDSEKDIINITKLFLILNGYRLIEKQDNIIKSLNKKDWKYRIEKLENGWMIQASFLYCMSSVYHYKLEITDKGKIKIVERPEFPRAL